MSRAFSVPLYTTATQIGGSVNKRAMSLTNPNSESTSTTFTVNLGNTTAPLRPEQSTGSVAVPASGQINAIGWGFAVADLLGVPFDSIDIEAGTWTVDVHYSRPGSLATGNITVNAFTIILSRVVNDPVAGASLQEIGRVTDSGFTITTTEQSKSINISGSAVTLNSGERIWMECYAGYPTHVTSDTARYHTQSSSALRISAVPNYTVHFGRALSDSPAASDALARATVNIRALADSAPASDALARAATFPRALFDDAPCSDGGANLLTADESSFETSTAGWQVIVTPATLAKSSAQARFGSSSLAATKITGSGNMTIGSPFKSGVVPGKVYHHAGWVRAATIARQFQPSIAFYQSDNNFIQTIVGSVYVDATNGWLFYGMDAIAPALAAKAISVCTWASVAVSEVHYVDGVSLSVSGLVRQVNYNRTLNDTPAVSDGLARQWTGARSLADSADVSDTLARMFSGARDLADVAGITSDQLLRTAIFNRALADGASASDALERAFTGARTIEDGPAVDDSLTRQVVYDRQLEDNLSEGGSSSPIFPVTIYDE